jgi:hypothetical protein
MKTENPLMPPDLVNRASALLVAREVRRPPDTLAPLAQHLLRWWTVLKGAPGFDPASLRPIAREFREMGFDCLPGKPPRWTTKQRDQVEALFDEMAILVAAGPELPLPELCLDLKPKDRSRLIHVIWNHLDYHVSALTLGLLGSRVLAVNPDDPRFEGQRELRERIVHIVSTLVAFALYLAGEHGKDMPVGQAATTVSALLDGLADSIDAAFRLGGTRGAWLARSGGWERPGYPCRMGEFGTVIQSLPLEIRPE